MTNKEEGPKKRILLYGPPKSWKTSSLATVPKGAKVHVVNADRQLGSLRQEWKKHGHNAKNLDWTTLPTKSANQDEIYEATRKALWKPPMGFDFYAIDTYTTVGILLTHAICGIVDREYNQANNADLSGNVQDLFWQYAAAVERLGAWLVVIMWEKWIEVDDGLSDPADWRSKTKQLVPDAVGQAKITIPGQCDFVFHVERGKSLTKTGTKAITKSVAKFRTKGTPHIMASTLGFDGMLNDTEPADIALIIKKLGLDWKAQPNKAKTKTRR
jgi:hypothetical protein